MVRVNEIFVVPFFGQGHLNPAMELCRNISYHNFNVTLIIPSHLSSSIPSTFSNHSSFIHVAEISVSTSSPRGETLMINDHQYMLQMGEGIKSFLSTKSSIQAKCVVIDIMMSWSKKIFVSHKIPVVSFSTSSATALAMDFGRWMSKVGDIEPGEIKELPKLPVEMAVTFADLSRRRLQPTIFDPNHKPSWMDAVAGSAALLINSSDNLERCFMDYLSKHIKFPIWGVGPLLPQQFWKSTGSILHDHEMMRSNHKSNYMDDEIIQWLDSKTNESVVYISFGSEFTPTLEEYKELSKALEESDHPFIWVISPGSCTTTIPRSYLRLTQTINVDEQEKGYYPEGLSLKVGNRGLIITGWSPQLLILSHPSTGGFLSHCGWNSTVEAIGLGVPILGWPLRGDQFDNAKMVAEYLKIGFRMSDFANEDEAPKMFRKVHMLAGIQRLMSDKEVHKQAKVLSKELESRTPLSLVEALIEFFSLTYARL